PRAGRRAAARGARAARAAAAGPASSEAARAASRAARPRGRAARASRRGIRRSCVALLAQLLAQELHAAVQVDADGAVREAGRRRDLPAVEALDEAQRKRLAVRLGQRAQHLDEPRAVELAARRRPAVLEL